MRLYRRDSVLEAGWSVLKRDTCLAMAAKACYPLGVARPMLQVTGLNIGATISRRRVQKGFSLVEMMIALLIGSIVILATATLSFYSARSFAALYNYVDLDQHSRNALDRMTWQIRQADNLVSYSTNQLTFAM